MWIMTEDGWKQLSPRVFVPAPQGGTFAPVSLDFAIGENAMRVMRYSNNVERYIAEEISLEEIYRCWDEPVRGAFGEIIR